MQPRTVRERVAYIFLEADPVHLAGLSGTAATLWGLVLLNPYAATFPTSKGYAFMASLFPEWVWGAVVASIGFWQVLSTLTSSLRGRLIVSALMCALWLAISIMFLVANPISTATAIYPVLAFASFITVYQRYAAWKGERHDRTPADESDRLGA